MTSFILSKRMTSATLILAMVFSIIFTISTPLKVRAADFTATVTFNMDSETGIAYKARGLNNPMNKGVMKYDTPDFINSTIPLELGWIRWPGGTNAMLTNWKTGYTDEQMLAQIRRNDELYLSYIDFAKAQRGTGSESPSDFKNYLQQVGAKAIIPVNAMTDDVDAIKDLAKYVKDNNIPVIYWELSNEPYFFQGTGSSPELFKNGTDYVIKMMPYNDAIKSILPDAKTLICYSENPVSAWNDAIYAYANPYWDGINFHRYEGDGATADEVIRSANTAMANTSSDLQAFISRMHDPNAPIFIGEMGFETTAPYNSTVYHGIFNAESIMRVMKTPNVKYTGAYRLYDGYIKPGDKHSDDAIDKYQRGEAADPSQYDFDLYSSAAAVMTKVSDIAINNSSAHWSTTVTGGSTVNKTTGTMPAIYSQAYKGDNGKDYVVIVNKSSYSHDVTLKKTQNSITTDLSGTLTKVSAQAPLDSSGNPVPTANNTSTSKNKVSISTASTGNPVLIQPYSVTRVEWDSGRAAVLKKSYVTHADITSTGTVRVKWLPADGAVSYNVKYGTTAGNYTLPSVLTTNTYADLTGLTAGTTYYISVESVASGGAITLAENEVSIKMAKPAAPLMRSAYIEGSGKVGVEWQSVPGAAGYRVKYGTTSGSYTTTVDAGNMCGTIIKGLTDGASYYFVVRAYNAYGESVNSAEDAAHPIYKVAYAPNDLDITSQTATSAALEWKQSYFEDYQGFFETGDGTNTGWTVRSGQPWVVADHPDTTRLTDVYKCTTNERSIITRGSSVWTNYEIDAKINVTSYVTAGRIGVVGRFQDVNNYYYFTYDNAVQQFKLAKYVNGNTSAIQTVTIAEAGNPNINDMRMMLRMEGTSLKCYLNDKLIIDAIESSFNSGFFGLWSNQIAYFDEVIMRRPNTDGALGTYRLFRSTQPDTGFTEIANNIPGETYTDNTCTSGVIYYYKLKGVNDTGSSVGFSNTVTKR